MNQSATAFLGKADEALSKARRIIGIEIYDEAGRHAYYAAYHAAQALIFERTGKVSRTHKGVNAQFAKLVVTESSLSRDHVRFLARAYRLKAIP